MKRYRLILPDATDNAAQALSLSWLPEAIQGRSSHFESFTLGKLLPLPAFPSASWQLAELVQGNSKPSSALWPFLGHLSLHSRPQSNDRAKKIFQPQPICEPTSLAAVAYRDELQPPQAECPSETSDCCDWSRGVRWCEHRQAEAGPAPPSPLSFLLLFFSFSSFSTLLFSFFSFFFFNPVYPSLFLFFFPMPSWFGHRSGIH